MHFSDGPGCQVGAVHYHHARAVDLRVIHQAKQPDVGIAYGRTRFHNRHRLADDVAGRRFPSVLGQAVRADPHEGPPQIRYLTRYSVSATDMVTMSMSDALPAGIDAGKLDRYVAKAIDLALAIAKQTNPNCTANANLAYASFR